MPAKSANKKDPKKDLKKDTPKKVKTKYDIFVYNDWCKKCGICEAFCPVKCLGHDEIGQIVVLDADACIGCAQCEIRCPDFAIEIKVRE